MDVSKTRAGIFHVLWGMCVNVSACMYVYMFVYMQGILLFLTHVLMDYVIRPN